MTVVAHDDVNLFSLGPGRISKSRLKSGFIYFFLIKRKALEQLHLCRGKIFLLLLLYRETSVVFW